MSRRSTGERKEREGKQGREEEWWRTKNRNGGKGSADAIGIWATGRGSTRTEKGEGMYMNRWNSTGERGHCWSLSMGQRSTGEEGNMRKGDERGEGEVSAILYPARAPPLGPASEEGNEGREEPEERKGNRDEEWSAVHSSLSCVMGRTLPAQRSR